MRAERAPRVRGVHEGLRGALGVHVAHFRPICLTARMNSPRRPTSPITSRTAPTRFDARSSRGGRPERSKAADYWCRLHDEIPQIVRWQLPIVCVPSKPPIVLSQRGLESAA